VRLDLWAIVLSTRLVFGTVAPSLAPVLRLAGTIVAMGALLRRDLVPIFSAVVLPVARGHERCPGERDARPVPPRPRYETLRKRGIRQGVPQ
jgi:hypothetical protein